MAPRLGFTFGPVLDFAGVLSSSPSYLTSRTFRETESSAVVSLAK